jgi:peptidoglycan/LPS O-acetylase OafA/YrhL
LSSAKPASQTTEGRLPAYIPELDGIRAIAVLMVLMMHVFTLDGQSSAALRNVAPRAITLLIGHGWLGVDLFFVLSGFLITGILLDTRKSPHYFRNFYGRRALRILPLYLLCIAVLACFYPGCGAYFLLSLLFVANMAGLLGVSVPHGAGVFWSLAVEEHFYLIWPWLVRMLSRRALVWVCALIIISEPILRAVFAARGTDVYNPSWFRFDGLASGALLAVWFRSPLASQRRSLIAAVASIAVAVAITIAGLPFGIMAKTVAGMSLRYNQATLVYCAGMLVAVAWRSTWLTAPLRSKFARHTGALSYCLYLIHLALLDGYMVVFRHYVPAGLTFSQLLLRAVVVLCASYGLALLSQHFLERPVLSLKRYLTNEPREMRRAETIAAGWPIKSMLPAFAPYGHRPGSDSDAFHQPKQ